VMRPDSKIRAVIVIIHSNYYPPFLGEFMKIGFLKLPILGL
jgi:hypothetical protein